MSALETLSAGESPQERRIAGTLPYMSPEQARGEDLDARSDVFALGVVLYEMTTGQRPFAGGTLLDVAQRILDARPKPVHELVPGVPRDLDRIIHKALASHRGDRYQTMDDQAVDLKLLGRDLGSNSAPSFDDLEQRQARGRPRGIRAKLGTFAQPSAICCSFTPDKPIAIGYQQFLSLLSIQHFPASTRESPIAGVSGGFWLHYAQET